MEAQNATTWEDSHQAAMGEEGEYAGEAPQEGQPPHAQKRVFAGKFVSEDELEKSYLEAEKKIQSTAEEKKRLESELLNAREQLSYAERARLAYEQEMFRQKMGSAQTKDPVAEQFKSYVNEDERVYESVKNLAKHEADGLLSQRVLPEVEQIRSELRQLRTNNFNMALDGLKKTNPEIDRLLPEIMQEAKGELSDLMNLMIQRGINPDVAVHVASDLNSDINYVQRVAHKVMGSKGPNYWAERLKSNSSKEQEETKAHLGGGGSTSSGTPLSDEQIKKALGEDPKKAREMLFRAGLFKSPHFERK